MCGIVGAVGTHEAVTCVLEGLRRLEYRGYDSAGIATLEHSPLTEGTPQAGQTHPTGDIQLRRAVGKISALEACLQETPFKGHAAVAIGHTRWATHGEPCERNAHPHITDRCAVVHNGIIENFLKIKERLQSKGVVFHSDTDTEVLPALITEALENGKQPLEAVLGMVGQLEGSFAFAAIFKGQEDLIIATRRGAPLVLGVGQEGKMYLGSDPLALAPYTHTFVFLENDDIAIITPTSYKVVNKDGEPLERIARTLDLSSVLTGKNGYRHFMLKEIYEQPMVCGETLLALLNGTQTAVELPSMPFSLKDVEQVNIVACGTSWHAAMVAKYWFEQVAHLAVSVDIASEFRYRNPPLAKNGLMICISQSGETADTLAALEYAKAAGQKVLSIVNVQESSIARASDAVLYTQAGPEIGVASTKAFTTQLTVLAVLAIATARAKGLMTEEKEKEHIAALRELPARMLFLPDTNQQMADIAQQFLGATSSLYLGRGTLFPIALEGALKLKEISYIHAEGYAAGEMKHGPIALIEENVPVVVLAPYNDLFEKTLSNLQEVEARRGKSILITDAKGAQEAGEHPERIVIEMPTCHPFIQPILYTLPMQLLAYHVAVLKGTDVDQPRNLAKSVTVE